MISKFFIDRPIFASVLSIVIVLAGLLAMRALPIAQYPEIVPPQVVVSATYPGASAQTIAETVAAPLEQQINGVEDMIYMQSTSTGSGHAEPVGLLPDRHRRRPGDHQRQQPGPARDGPPARGGAAAGRHGRQAVDLDPAGPGHVVARPALRHDLHLQLRPDQRHRRAAAHAGRRRRLAVRRLRLLDAHLAQARQGRAVQSDAERHRRRHPRAERPVRRRALRARSRCRASRPSPIRSTTPGPPRRSARVRADHPALGRERRRPAAQGRRARRARLAELRHRGDPQRRADGADRHLSPARTPTRSRSRAPSRPRWSGSRSASPTGLRYDVPFNTTRFIEVSIEEVVADLRRGHRPRGAWSCSCSCRTGARRSSRSWPCRSRSSAPSRACTCSASRSTCSRCSA